MPLHVAIARAVQTPEPDAAPDFNSAQPSKCSVSGRGGAAESHDGR
jgi:hypothetical protein